MSIREELETIQGNEELLSPVDVVSWARSHPASSIYKSLEWDDGVAAENWRVWQARRLIAVHIVSDEGYRQMISLRVDRISDGGYRRIDDVLPMPDLRQMMLDEALQDLQRLQKKYAKLQELASVWEAAHQIKTRRGRRQARQAERSAVQPSPA